MSDDAAIRTLVARLARAHPSGGHVIERASILAEGGDVSSVVDWIVDHDGVPESAAAKTVDQGLHGSGFHDRGAVRTPVPRRWILPPGTLD